jgi:hypothetical protein
MLKNYSHIRMKAKRTALESILAERVDSKPALRETSFEESNTPIPEKISTKSLQLSA